MVQGTLRQVFKRQSKSAWLALRLTPAQKDSIKAAARSVGLGMSAYMLQLHAFAVKDTKNGARA